MNLAIAILALISWFFGILISATHAPCRKVESRTMMCSVAVISWWNICLPVSITLIVLGIFFIFLFSISNNQHKD